MQELTCPNCGAKMKIEDQNAKSVRCQFCDSVIKFQGFAEDSQDARDIADFLHATAEQKHALERLKRQEEKRIQEEQERQEFQEWRDTELAKFRKRLRFSILLTIAGVLIYMIPLAFFHKCGKWMGIVGALLWIYTGSKVSDLKDTYYDPGDDEDEDGESDDSRAVDEEARAVLEQYNQAKDGLERARILMEYVSRTTKDTPILPAPRVLRDHGENFAEVKTKLTAMGYINISCVPLEDVPEGLEVPPGSVSSVTINGKCLPPAAWAKVKDKFPVNAQVIISYYSFTK